MSQPLVTFLLVGYNQEQFIREAIAGAFAQTYSPLEIIMSDDCSPDRTFEIMQEMVTAYRGPHVVSINRAPANQGICPQIDAAVKLARGEWIVIAAGDDISLPNRVAEHMAIANAHRDVYSSFLAPLPFGNCESGRVPVHTNRVLHYPETLKADGRAALGATHAFRTSAWKVFGDLGPNIIAEDLVIPFRSSLLGSVVLSDRPGVRYRVHGNSVTAEYWGKRGSVLPSAKQLRLELSALVANRKDLQKAVECGLVASSDGLLGLGHLTSALITNEIIIRCIEAKGIASWISPAFQLLLCRQFLGSKKRRISLLWHTMRQARRNSLANSG